MKHLKNLTLHFGDCSFGSYKKAGGFLSDEHMDEPLLPRLECGDPHDKSHKVRNEDLSKFCADLVGHNRHPWVPQLHRLLLVGFLVDAPLTQGSL